MPVASKNNMENNIENLTGEQLRAIVQHFRYRLDVLSEDRDKIKKEFQPYLDLMNKRGAAIAKKHGGQFVKFTFIGLMR